MSEYFWDLTSIDTSIETNVWLVSYIDTIHSIKNIKPHIIPINTWPNSIRHAKAAFAIEGSCFQRRLTVYQMSNDVYEDAEPKWMTAENYALSNVGVSVFW